MSITVNYKGEQIAQSAGDNLTLNTAGKYMEADVILSASGGGSPSVVSGTCTFGAAAGGNATVNIVHNLGRPVKCYALVLQDDYISTTTTMFLSYQCVDMSGVRTISRSRNSSKFNNNVIQAIDDTIVSNGNNELVIKNGYQTNNGIFDWYVI